MATFPTANGTAAHGAPESPRGPRGTGPRSLLAHIAFHYVESRAVYLEEIVKNFASYELDRIEVVVDTNSESTRDFLATLPVAPHVTVRAEVHTTLAHRFGLTWAHRSPMAARVSEFDLFMYLEDDILVPWPAVRSWMADNEALYAQGFLRGFVRVEKNAQSQLMATDWMEALRNALSYQIAGSTFVRPTFPYQAFWIYTAKQMRDFMALEIWSPLGLHKQSTLFQAQVEWWSSPESMRERAAYGMIFAHAGPHRVLLPLASNNQVHPDCYVHHLPNTYGLLPVGPLARIRVEAALHGRPVAAHSLAGVAVKARDRVETEMTKLRQRVRQVPWLLASARAVDRALFPNRDRHMNH